MPARARRVLAALALAGVAATGFAALGTGAEPLPPVAAKPRLGAADPATVLMGAAPLAAPGEAWGYRLLAPEVGTVEVDGRPLEFGPPRSTQRQLAFLRHRDGKGWQVAETPVDLAGEPYRGFAPNRRSGRVTPRGGGLLVGRDAGRRDAPLVVLLRDVGGRFTETAPFVGEGEEVLATGQGLGRVAAALVEEDEHAVAYAGVLGTDPEATVARYDPVARAWTREPVAVPEAEREGFRIVAIDGSSAEHLWLLGTRADGGLLLFERTSTAETATWEPRELDTGLGSPRPLEGSADPLTVVKNALWIDAESTQGDATAYVRTAGDAPYEAETWCDAGAPACDFRLGAQFSRREGYVSIGFDGPGRGGRVISNPLLTGSGGDETNRGTYLRLTGDTFVRVPGGGGNFRPSAAFATPDDGWLEGPVRIDGAPRPDPLRAWPAALRSPLTAAVPAPGQPAGSIESGALAVGQDGAVVRYTPGRGWVREFLLSSSGAVARPLLRGVAWPEPTRAHAVGDLGNMWLWRAETGLWERDPAAPIGSEANFMSVAFQPGAPERGYAVGKQGVILRYDKSWTQDALPEDVAGRDITQVSFAASQAIAVAGEDVLVNDGAGWRVDEGVRALFEDLPGATAQLFAVAGLPDGSAVVGGAGVVLQRDGAGGTWRFSEQPISGATVVAAGAFKVGEKVRAVVAVQPLLRYPVPDVAPEISPDQPPVLIPPFPLPGDGYVLRQTDEGWSDEQQTAYAGSGFDRPVKSDPVAAFVLDAGGEGWAIGGWSGEADSAGRGNSNRTPQGRADRARAQTAGIYRYTAGSPQADPAGAAQTGTALPAGKVRFVVAGHAQCQERCVDLRDQTIAPDRLLRRTREATRQLAGQAEGPRMLLYTGGRTDPATPGRQDAREADRFAELLIGGDPGPPVYAAPSAGDTEEGATGPYRSAFATAPAPFGSGAVPSGVSPLDGEVAASEGARTHYAFESDGTGGKVRVIVIDNSRGSLEASDPHQNPPEPQLPWLVAQLAAAKTAGVPAIVVGSRDLNARVRPRLNAATDADLVARALVEGGASAYLFERPEENRVYSIPSGAEQTIPSFGTGTLGYRSPIANPTRDEPDALFGENGFLLAEVDVAGRDTTTNRAPVTVRFLPLVDDLTVQAVDGTLLRRSRPALFQGLGRRPISGDRWGPVGAGGGDPQPPGGDPYAVFPPVPCTGGGCASRIAPEFEFVSSDPDIGDFIAQDSASTNLRKPLLSADGKVVTDNRSGLFCPFNPGNTTVTIKTGGLAYSQAITVLGGSVQRPCGTRPLVAERFTRTATTPATAPPPAPAPAPVSDSSPPPPVPPPPPPAAVKAVPKPKARPLVQPQSPPPPPIEAPPVLEPANARQIPGQPPPPASSFARPIPPGGAVIRVLERQREEEAAPEQSKAASVYVADEPPRVPGYLPGLILIAAVAGASVHRDRRRRHERPAFVHSTSRSSTRYRRRP